MQIRFIVPQKGSVATPLLLTAYLLWPGAEWGFTGGIPLGQAGVLALAAVWIIWAFGLRSAGWPIAATLVVLKMGVGALLVERGLVAEYFANPGWLAPAERSTEYPRAQFTRIDRELDFGPDRASDAPLFFVNDFQRFNYYRPDEPSRASLPYSAAWTGVLFSEEPGPLHVYIRGSGIKGEVTVDGLSLASLSTGETGVTGAKSLGGGWRRLRVTMSSSYGSQRAFSAGIVDASGRERPFSEKQVFTRRMPRGRMLLDRIARVAAVAIDGAVLLWLAVAALRVTSLPHLLWIGAVLEAWMFARRWDGRLMVLDGGSDPLTYETYARDILLHGPLMTMGQPVGDGGPFYYQPLYPYVLAALHWIGGDGFFVVVFAQRLAVAVSLALLWQMTRRLFGDRVGRVGLGVAGVFLYVKAGPLASTLLGEAVFVPLVCAWTVLLMALAERESDRAAVWAGVAGGLATLSRSTLLLAWPVAAGLVAAARRKVGSFRRSIVVMGAVLVAVVAMATLRNWIVARQFVPITTSFSVNLYLGNEPPASLDTHGVDEFWIYRWIGRDDMTRKTLEFAVHAPAWFARNILNKALYALGFFGAYVSGAGVAPSLVACWIAAACGAWLTAFRRAAHTAPGAVQAIPGAVALAHFAAVVLIFPHVYGDRLILPFYVLILPYAAVAAATLLPHDIP